MLFFPLSHNPTHFNININVNITEANNDVLQLRYLWMLLGLEQLGTMGSSSCNHRRHNHPRIPILVRLPISFSTHNLLTNLTGALATAAVVVAECPQCMERVGCHTVVVLEDGETNPPDSSTKVIITTILIMVARHLRMSLRSWDNRLAIPLIAMRDIMAIMRTSCSNHRAVISLNGVGILSTMRQMDHHLGRAMALFDKGIENNGIIGGVIMWGVCTGPG
jgi:hypothetical protein